MASAGALMRALQDWMCHRDYKTTSIYADYAADPSQGAYYAALRSPIRPWNHPRPSPTRHHHLGSRSSPASARPRPKLASGPATTLTARDWS